MQSLTKPQKNIDEKNANWLEAAQIQSRFLKIGVRSFTSFYGVVAYHYPEFDAPENKKFLVQYWNGRLMDQDLNKKLVSVIENMQHG